MGGSGDLIDLTVLLLHAGAGLGGDGRGLISRAARVLHRAFHFGDDRLQLVEKTVEPARQLAKFVLLVIGQATGQVAFATGDVFEHVRDAEDRSGHAARHQPHQQQAEQGGEAAEAQLHQRARGIARVQLLLERFGAADQNFFRHIEQHAPRRPARNWLERREHFQLAVVVQAAHARAGRQTPQQLSAAGGVDDVQTLTEFAGIGAVTGEQAGGADDADGGLTVVKLFARGLADRLQAVEVDVDRQRGDDLAVEQQREDDAGHQHFLPVDHVKVRFDHARLEGAARAGEPGVGRLTAGAGAGVAHVAFRQGHRVDLARGRLRPVQRKTALVVAAQLILPGEQFVLAVQRVGFEYQ